jgi:hypothetical protein
MKLTSGVMESVPAPGPRRDGAGSCVCAGRCCCCRRGSDTPPGLLPEWNKYSNTWMGPFVMEPVNRWGVNRCNIIQGREVQHGVGRGGGGDWKVAWLVVLCHEADVCVGGRGGEVGGNACSTCVLSHTISQPDSTVTPCELHGQAGPSLADFLGHQPL